MLIGAPLMLAAAVASFLIGQAYLLAGIDTAARFQTNQVAIEALDRAANGAKQP